MQGRRKVQKSGGLVVLGGDNVSPLVEIGLSDLPKTGGARAPPHSAAKVRLRSTFGANFWNVSQPFENHF